MIIDYLHIACISIVPNEAQPIAIVDPNAVLSGAAVFQCLQRVPRGTKIVETLGRVQLEQFASRNLLDGLKLLRPGPEEEPFGFGVSKGADHLLIVYR
jgi:hypothetical protein